MVEPSYIPDRGDIAWVTLDPALGREQRGRRPVVVISPKIFNRASGLMIACPMTSKAKGYPFEVLVKRNKTRGVALVDQMSSWDWSARSPRFIESMDRRSMNEVVRLARLLIGSPS